MPLKNVSGVYSSSLHPCPFGLTDKGLGLTHKGPPPSCFNTEDQKVSLASVREKSSCFIPGDSGSDRSSTEQ